MKQVSPAFADFATAHNKGSAQLLWTVLPADLDTPISAWLKMTARPFPKFEQVPYACLFESVEGGRHRGRYSVLALAPDLVLRGHGAQMSCLRPLESDEPQPQAEKGLACLRKLWKESRIKPSPPIWDEKLPPMSSGLFGYLGFEVVRLFEGLPESSADPLAMPDWFFIRPALVVIFDSVLSCIFLVATSHAALRARHSARRAYRDARALLQEGAARLSSPLEDKAAERGKFTATSPVKAHVERKDFLDSVVKAKEHIFAGDIFQVVLSQRFSMGYRGSRFGFYRSLRRVNPSPYLFFLDFEEAVAGSSPEILVRVRGGQVSVRPIAGTRPRGATMQEDEAIARELLADPKERAEHLMLLDLGRNDVGRVAEVGSVRVSDSFSIERYSQVMHIVSHVEGRLRKGYDALDALVAGFPAGTVTGAPKIRAMQILTELEGHHRGLYSGGVGWLGANGDMDTCIVLRTGILKRNRLHVQVGAGIVADSVPEREYEECENKARALFKAAQEA